MSLALRQLSTADAGFDAALARLLHAGSPTTDGAIEQRVADILTDVRARGDVALLEYTARFDRVAAASVAALELGRGEMRAACDTLPTAQRNALEAAAQRVRAYHERQMDVTSRSWSYRDDDGTLLGQQVTPLDRVGIYVPGGKAAFPSSVLILSVSS